ncbi:DinB family protein [Paenibacillus sp. ACRRX]|uniref:DinB family protein n=1 Tax=Paenibacillus sp. ACRRX TaxID=2918206 RepID=UPI001EF44D9B|nr:DinB family protein [Paenibacillus sp. ACRRX]MCG7410056.1 DinB family protein [Paenibacillus sp. ACRRX]
MTTKQEKISIMKELISFVESLKPLDETTWSTPLQEGKWSPCEIIGHIALWDRFFYEGAVLRIAQHEPLTLKKVDFEQFNREASEYSKTVSKDALLELTIQNRADIIAALHRIPDEEYPIEHGSGKLSVDSYIDDFKYHDHHHMDQIKRFLEAKSSHNVIQA